MELQANVQRQLEATLSRALELNDQFFQQERDKLEAWAEDRIASAEQALKDTKLKLKGLKRQARMALSMEDAQRLQQDIRKTESSRHPEWLGSCRGSSATTTGRFTGTHHIPRVGAPGTSNKCQPDPARNASRVGPSKEGDQAGTSTRTLGTTSRVAPVTASTTMRPNP